MLAQPDIDAVSIATGNLIARYRELLDSARDDADLKQILGALGGVLEKSGVRAEAEVAVKENH
ncbi:MAG: hypothetical protein MUF81_06515 [Verrucomicrobia bacterium]|nr:hypothetical protein [Verrucomicrobiota bacterium]